MSFYLVIRDALKKIPPPVPPSSDDPEEEPSTPPEGAKVAIPEKIFNDFEAAGILQLRFESRARDAENEDNLAMRTADPLWILGRQWQFGEFQAEDNGSPIQARIRHQRRALPYQVDAWPAEGATPAPGPLEAQVEAMKFDPMAFDLRTRVKTGQQLDRILRRRSPGNILPTLRQLKASYPLQPAQKMDDYSTRYWMLMKPRVADGGLMIQALNSGRFDHDALGMDKAVTDEWLAWYQDLYFQPSAEQPPTWKAGQLLHAFRVPRGADEQAECLHAPDYRSGTLDWYSFDFAHFQPRNLLAKVVGETHLPVNLTFAAMPDKRLFAFESSHLDLGSMEVDNTDMLRLLLLDYALLSGSDWYLAPLKMQLGEACWIEEVEVQDTFGIFTSIQNNEQVGPALSARSDLLVWDVFKIRDTQLATYNPIDHFLYLPPISGHREASPPIEELLLLRDEYANMIWAVEQRVKNYLGNTLDGYDLHLELNGPFVDLAAADREDPESLPIFRFATNIPSNWIPYLPRGTNEFIVRRAFMTSNEPDRPLREIPPLSYLAGQELIEIQEDAIPKAGVRIQLTRQRLRWTDGQTYVWQGRQVRVGRGEGNSGLQFDGLINRKTT